MRMKVGLVGATMFAFSGNLLAQEAISLADPEVVSASEGLLSSGIWALVQMIVVLIAVVGLAYLVLHKGFGSFIQRAQANKTIQIKERIALDQKRFLYLVEIDQRRLLLGAGDHSLSLITDLTPGALSAQTGPISFSSSLERGVFEAYDLQSHQKPGKPHVES